MRKILSALLLCLAPACLIAQASPAVNAPAPAAHLATVREYTQAITTYPFSDPNPIALLSPVYPYFRFDGFTDKPVQKNWKVVCLENDYIKVLILPEVGGKVWTAIEKSAGSPFYTLIMY